MYSSHILVCCHLGLSTATASLHLFESSPSTAVKSSGMMGIMPLSESGAVPVSRSFLLT
eukprot:m.5394 g.5394  ORF g.5394 m.5394 type:complete len:59 (+) comp13049_c0_seq1:137-313(+)